MQALAAKYGMLNYYLLHCMLVITHNTTEKKLKPNTPNAKKSKKKKNNE
jgi:hypothetical protein